MKYVIIRCEDSAAVELPAPTLLQGAKTHHLQSLAQAGAAGAIRGGETGAINRLELYRALCGVPAAEPPVAGRCYAAEVNMQVAPEEVVWCCELVTQRDGRLVDATAGQITTKESQLLIQSLDERLGSDTRHWHVGAGSHHVLLTTDPALTPQDDAALPSPEQLLGTPWARAIPKSPLGEGVQRLLEEAASVLETHPVNRVRIDLGENPANAMWLWGPARGGETRPTFGDRTGLSGTVMSGSFPMKGLARTLGLDWHEAPGSFDEPSVHQLAKALFDVVDRRDFVYLHLNVGTADPVQRLCAMERIDQLILKPLTERLPQFGAWRLLAAVDDRSKRSVPFVAVGTNVTPQPADQPLTFDNGTALFSWFTKP